MNVGLGTRQLVEETVWNAPPTSLTLRHIVITHTGSISHRPDDGEGEGNLESIVSTSSMCLSWFSRLSRSCMATSWFIRLFCISFSWSISFCSRASSCACMAASISLSWATVADTSVVTLSIIEAFFLFAGTLCTRTQTVKSSVSARTVTPFFFIASVQQEVKSYNNLNTQFVIEILCDISKQQEAFMCLPDWSVRFLHWWSVWWSNSEDEKKS